MKRTCKRSAFSSPPKNSHDTQMHVRKKQRGCKTDTTLHALQGLFFKVTGISSTSARSHKRLDPLFRFYQRTIKAGSSAIFTHCQPAMIENEKPKAQSIYNERVEILNFVCFLRKIKTINAVRHSISNFSVSICLISIFIAFVGTIGLNRRRRYTVGKGGRQKKGCAGSHTHSNQA